MTLSSTCVKSIMTIREKKDRKKNLAKNLEAKKFTKINFISQF